MLGKGRMRGILSALLLIAALAACGGASEAPGLAPTDRDDVPTTSTPHLDRTRWVLLSLNGSSLIEGSNITLNFDEGRAGGFAGCNSYGGEYTADESTLTVPEMEITAQDCPLPEGIMEQEAAYLEALRDRSTYRATADRLQLANDAGETTLIFARVEEFSMDPGDLVGAGWQLVLMNGSPSIEGSSITIAFSEGRQMRGQAGCRGYVGAYEASGDDIGFPMLSMMGDPCLEQEAIMQQEGQYTDALSWATNYRLVEGQLEIVTARGETLVFEPLAEDAGAGLEGRPWTLIAFVEEKAVEEMSAPLPMVADRLPGTEITAAFADAAVSGSAGCNTYEAAYTFADPSIRFETPTITEMACTDPAGVMEQEQQYLGWLGDVTALRIYGSQLWLETDDGRALVFSWAVSGHSESSPSTPAEPDCTSLAAVPPEDAEWVWPELTEVQPAQAAPGDEIRILAVGGYLHWENECGSGVDESARSFQISIGDMPLGSLDCYVNHCEADLAVPGDLPPGSHTISVEGGSSLNIQIVGD